MNRCNFEQFLSGFEKRGKELFGDHFKIYDTDKDVLLRLLVYFLNDKEEALELGLSFRKGIVLNGKVGCGKTAIMTLFRLFLSNEQRYQIKSCRNISFQFIKQGYDVINDYSKVSLNNPYSSNYCFDDLGTEKSLRHFGNECNVMREIILSRYDSFISHKIITHITTNLNSSEIEEFYGTRVRSRMREMFNLVSFDANTADKRT
jgi:hypothetical protein